MPRKISEERTRKEMIDPSTGSGHRPQLEGAGWYVRDHSKVKIEIPVDGYDAEPWNGVTDYCLYRENGEVLAVVEAKKTAEIKTAIADRSYQHEAIRHLGKAVVNRKRKSLIVMPKRNLPREPDDRYTA